MGRRALRKINPNLDLTSYLYALADLPEPLNTATFFRQAAPLEIEVGSGKGLFLSGAAATHPETNYIGIEIAGKYAAFCAARLARRDLNNAVVIHGDAWRFFSQWLTTASVAAVHVYFPDPWWKKRHKKRRIMNTNFLKRVENVLVSGGTLHFWTDVEEYYRGSLELIAAATVLEGPLVVPENRVEHDLDYRTHFERRTRLAGAPVYRAAFLKQ